MPYSLFARHTDTIKQCQPEHASSSCCQCTKINGSPPMQHCRCIWWRQVTPKHIGFHKPMLCLIYQASTLHPSHGALSQVNSRNGKQLAHSSASHGALWREKLTKHATGQINTDVVSDPSPPKKKKTGEDRAQAGSGNNLNPFHASPRWT